MKKISSLSSFCPLVILILTLSFPLSADIKLSKNERKIIQHVNQCVNEAEQNSSKINEEILQIPGMSGAKIRHFLNNLCSRPKTVYLEIGCWKGSTLISALFKNSTSVVDAIGIENWSQFGGPKDDFFKNVNYFIPELPLCVIEDDCFKISHVNNFPKRINTYFYDGDHSFADQEAAFTDFNDVFDDLFIAMVDDWNWEQVRDGTFSAFKKLGYTVLFEKQIFTGYNGDPNGWWNGFYIAVIRKNPVTYPKIK